MVGLKGAMLEVPTPRRARPVTAARRPRSPPFAARPPTGLLCGSRGPCETADCVRHSTARWLDARKAGGSTLRSPAARHAKGRRLDTRKARWLDARQGRVFDSGLAHCSKAGRSIAGLRFGIEAVMASRRGARMTQGQAYVPARRSAVLTSADVSACGPSAADADATADAASPLL
jgi:hypothetical protein